MEKRIWFIKSTKQEAYGFIQTKAVSMGSAGVYSRSSVYVTAVSLSFRGTCNSVNMCISDSLCLHLGPFSYWFVLFSLNKKAMPCLFKCGFVLFSCCPTKL